MAETWRLVEEARGAPERDPAIETAARAAAPGFVERVVWRAERLGARAGAGAELARIGRGLRIGVALALGVAVLLGVAAAQALPAGEPARANVVALLGVLILPHGVALLAWIAVSLAGARAGGRLASGELGRLPVLLLRLRRDDGGRGRPVRVAALRAWLGYLFDTASGRARLALVTHGCWLALLAGALAACWWLLSVRQVDFHWGSTLLGEATVERLLLGVAAPLEALGLPVPDAEDIGASRLGAAPPAAGVRQRWGLLILGALTLYGLVPRALAFVLTLVLIAPLDRRLALRLNRPGYARLVPLLRDETGRAIRDADEEGVPLHEDPLPLVAAAPPPAGAWLALERELAAPPDAVLDFGTVATREHQDAVLAAIAGVNPPWQRVVIQATLDTTPDRGLAHFVARLQAAATRPVHLVLREARASEAWSPAERRAREADWTRLALGAGIAAATIQRLCTERDAGG